MKIVPYQPHKRDHSNKDENKKMFDANSSFLSQTQNKAAWNQSDQPFNQPFQPTQSTLQQTWFTIPVDGTSFTLVQADNTQWSTIVQINERTHTLKEERGAADGVSF